MIQRERILAISVGGVFGLVVFWFVASWVQGGFTKRQQQINALRNEIQAKERKQRLGRAAAARLNRLREQALPSDTQLARSLYQNWLLELVEHHNLKNINVSASGGHNRNDVYFALGFTVACKGNLEQLTRLLHDYYSADLLHRIRRLSVRPIKDSKDLDLSFAIEAVSLPSAVQDATLNEEKSDRLHGPVDEYLTAIVNRNLFGPGNRPPKLASIGTQRVELGKSLSLTLKATEPDPLDTVSFSLVEAEATDLRLDAKSGELRWSPRSKGDYQVTVLAKDDGLPAKSDRQSFKISVVDPPPRQPDPPPVAPSKPKLEFDNAKYTFLTAIVEVAGQPQVWLSVRTTNELLKLKEGDKLTIGSVQGVVARISETTAEFDTDEKRLQVSIGETLSQGRSVERAE